MEYRPLGRTGVSVSQLCLGAMMFGAFGNPDHDDSIRIIHRALDAGINFIDTADVYSAGESEEIVGKALAGGRRDDVVLATKVGLPFGEDPNQRGTSRRWISAGGRELPAPARHRLDRPLPGPPPGPGTDIDETLGALSDLVHAGKIRTFGASTVPASQIVEAQWAAERRGRERFRTEQPPYSILDRARSSPTCSPPASRYGMGVLTCSPLAGGWLRAATARARRSTGRARHPRASASPARYDLTCPANQRKLDAADALATLADEAGITSIQLAIAFVRAPPGRHVGDHRPAHDGAPRVASSAADGVELSDERARPDRRDRAAGTRTLVRSEPAVTLMGWRT